MRPNIEEYKKIKCPGCCRIFYAYPRIGKVESPDGWHGECRGAFCDYTYFEEIKIDKEAKK